MKKWILIAVVVCLGTLALAQIGAPTSDVLGAHLNYGRGCAGCHAPHGAGYGNGSVKANGEVTVNSFLWGQDTTPLQGVTITLSGNVVEVLPSSLSAPTPDAAGILLCLSCHDGNLAKGAMMQNKVYEQLPATYGSYNDVPTLLGNAGALGSPGSYLATHPVGLNAIVTCGGTYGWDCTESNGVISMTGTNSAAFVQNYGFFVRLAAYNNTAVVTCITCHDQHRMNAFRVTNGPNSGLSSGVYITTFFIRGPYNVASTTLGSNQTAQFCRQCHGYQSNEMNGTLVQPTIF